MIGYINNLRNANYNLMNGRLGYTDRQDPSSLPLVPQEKIDFNDEYTANYHLDPNISAAYDMSVRLSQHGGMAQQERMIYDKRRSLDHALLFSYQGANISKVGEEKKVFRALINPNKLKQDYDDKIISVGFEYGLAPGDVFEWLGTKTHWLIYLQDLTELAYFRGDIRKCSYEIAWEDEVGDFEEMTVYVDATMMQYAGTRTLEFYIQKGPVRNGKTIPRLLFVTSQSIHLMSTLDNGDE